MRSRPEDFPGLIPEYDEVDEPHRSEPPYCFFGQVLAYDEASTLRSVGTGWLSNLGLVITAAHVLDGAASAMCSLPCGVVASWNNQNDIHPNYYDQLGYGQLGSIYDIAVMHPVSVPEGPFASDAIELMTNQNTAETLVIGYPGKGRPMVEHSGRTWRAAKYYGHAAHTDRGHSGTALLNNSAAVGLHVGRISLARKWQEEVEIDSPDGSNAAFVLSDQHIRFIKSRLT